MNGEKIEIRDTGITKVLNMATETVSTLKLVITLLEESEHLSSEINNYLKEVSCNLLQNVLVYLRNSPPGGESIPRPTFTEATSEPVAVPESVPVTEPVALPEPVAVPEPAPESVAVPEPLPEPCSEASSFEASKEKTQLPEAVHQQPTDAATLFSETTATGKRDFTRWCKTLNLPQGTHFYLTGGGQNKQIFKLVWTKDRKALLETTCSDGTVLRGKSPSGILKTYIEKVSNRPITQIDGWSRLSMRSPIDNRQWQLKDMNWMKWEYHPVKQTWINVEE